MSSILRYDLTSSQLTPEQLREAAACLLAGELIIYPTDTLYAIGCCALDENAGQRLRDAKGRDAGKPLPVIVTDVAQARSLVASWPDAAQRLADAFWPGPLTLVVPASPSLPRALLAGALSVAVRVPASDVARALARAAGPLVATSANLAGEPPCVTLDLALAAFPLATMALDVGLLDGAPSTLVDLSDPADDFRILREGRIDPATIDRALSRKV